MRLRRDSGAARGIVRCRIGAIGGVRLDGSGCQAGLGWVARDAANGQRAIGSLKGSSLGEKALTWAEGLFFVSA
jgi:hypothetical protein